MTQDATASYRLSIFEGEESLSWLRPGWRGLRLYGRRAKAAINANDIILKAELLSRADQLLTVMTGILDTAPGTTLGPRLMTIYASLRVALLRANTHNDCAALDDFDLALQRMDEEFLTLSHRAAEAA